MDRKALLWKASLAVKGQIPLLYEQRRIRGARHPGRIVVVSGRRGVLYLAGVALAEEPANLMSVSSGL
jgi:hypothetical protein